MFEVILSELAIYGSIAGVGVILLRQRFPEQWQVLFPTKQQQYETRTKQYEIEIKKLELLKSTLTKFKDAKSKHHSLVKETNDLSAEILKMESPKQIVSKSIRKEIETYFDSKKITK